MSDLPLFKLFKVQKTYTCRPCCMCDVCESKHCIFNKQVNSMDRARKEIFTFTFFSTFQKLKSLALEYEMNANTLGKQVINMNTIIMIIIIKDNNNN